jgi:dTDP-4-amino-4,6-dideoxygalactose transaminase
VKVPLLDLRAQFGSIEAEVRRQLDEVLASQHFILGPKVDELERRLAEYCGVATPLVSLPAPTRFSPRSWRSASGPAMKS